jgi:hypothetical protein
MIWLNFVPNWIWLNFRFDIWLNFVPNWIWLNFVPNWIWLNFVPNYSPAQIRRSFHHLAHE